MFKDLFDREVAPPHPGEIVRDDILPALALTRRELARRLKVSPRTLTGFLREQRPVTLDLALRLGSTLGQGARYWLSLQAQHDIWQAALVERSSHRAAMN